MNSIAHKNPSSSAEARAQAHEIIANADKELTTFVSNLPKAELHVHMEVPSPEIVLRVAERNGIPAPYKDNDDAIKLFDSSESLPEFIKNVWKGSIRPFIKEEDYYELALEWGAGAKQQNMLRREVLFNYGYGHEQRGVSLETVCKGLAAGRKAVKEKYDVDLYYIAEFWRNDPAEQHLAFVDKIAKYKEETGIVAVGIEGWGEEYPLEGSMDKKYPISDHKKTMLRAKELGFKTTAHLGETDGPWAFWDALTEVGLDRIDQGVRAIEDNELVDHIAQKGIPVCTCIGTNIDIPGYFGINAQPLKQFMDRGITLTINSDNPPLTRIDLNGCYVLAAEAFNLSYAQLADLARNSFTCAFATTEQIDSYLQKLDNWLTNTT